MQTGYSRPTGDCPRHLCGRAKQLCGGPRGRQSIGGRRLEKAVLDELLAVLEPASLEATAKALAEADAHHRQRLALFPRTDHAPSPLARWDLVIPVRGFDGCA